MRRLVTWLLVTLGIAALVRKLRRREDAGSSAVTTPSPAAAPATAEPMEAPSPVEEASRESEGDPAAELRERLARSRADMPSSDEESPEERRAAVHEQGRAALDEMQPSEDAAPESPAEQAREEQ